VVDQQDRTTGVAHVLKAGEADRPLGLVVDDADGATVQEREAHRHEVDDAVTAAGGQPADRRLGQPRHHPVIHLPILTHRRGRDEARCAGARSQSSPAERVKVTDNHSGSDPTSTDIE
jgi:hypothetical protein